MTESTTDTHDAAPPHVDVDDVHRADDLERDDIVPDTGPDGRLRRFDPRAALRRGFARDGRGWPPVSIALVTTAVWSWPVLRDFATARLANPGDSVSFEYYLSWNVHALVHVENPFVTPNLYAPAGMQLGNAISLPAVSLLVAPVTLLFGATAAYNVAFLLSVFFCGTAVYLFAREITGSAVGSTIAGALATMSPYFVGHALGHLNLMWTFGFPWSAYLVARHVNGRLRTRSFVGLVAVGVAFTFGASTELVVTESFFGVIALAVAGVFVAREVRRRLLRTTAWLVAGGAVGAVLASPVIWAALSAGIPAQAPNPPANYSSDLVNVFAPSPLFRFLASPFAPLWPHWISNSAENTAFLTVPLLALVLAHLTATRGRVPAAALTFAAIAVIASLGPRLVVDGTFTGVRMPWRVVEMLPGLSHALPGRFSAFAFMAICVLVAHAWSTRALTRPVVAVLVLAAVVSLVPDFAVMRVPARTADETFIATGAYRQVISRNENVLVLPAGEWGPGMEWIEESDFWFRMPTGNGGGASLPPELQDPVGRALFLQDPAFDYTTTLKPYLRRYGIGAVLVPDDDARYVAIATAALGAPDREVDGVRVWENAGT